MKVLGGYRFPGEVRAVFRTKLGAVRYVVEATGKDYAGMLHIFNGDQLARVEASEYQLDLDFLEGVGSPRGEAGWVCRSP